MAKARLHNGDAGYGNLTNLIRMKKVYMIEHQQGIGNDESPFRPVRTFFDEEGNMLNRFDPFKG